MPNISKARLFLEEQLGGKWTAIPNGSPGSVEADAADFAEHSHVHDPAEHFDFHARFCADYGKATHDFLDRHKLAHSTNGDFTIITFTSAQYDALHAATAGIRSANRDHGHSVTHQRTHGDPTLEDLIRAESGLAGQPR